MRGRDWFKSSFGDSKGWHDGVVVVLCNVFTKARGAFYVEEGAIEEVELGFRMFGAWGKACNMNCEPSLAFTSL